MEKLVVDGKVAVLYSPGYGAGWSTWNTVYPEIIFDPAIVKLVIEKRFDELETFVTLKYEKIYTGGLMDLEVVWVKEGRLFKIEDHDGNEFIEYKDEEDGWFVA
jgi:hypothetical protein